MTDEALASCSADVDHADREQLATDVADLLDEVAALRFNLTALVSTVHSS